MDTGIFWRVAVVQIFAVALVSLALALTLPHSFFTHWGWLTGPAAWLLCAWFTARFVRLPLPPTMVGALLAGIPSVLFVIVGLHWLGAVVAVGLFALWCTYLPLPLRQR